MTNGEKIIALTDRQPFMDNFGNPYMVFAKKWWNAEYKEPKEERINMAERIKLVNNAVEKTTAKWKQAIEDIKADIEHWESDDIQNDYQIGAIDMQKYVLRVIDKHTRELKK